MKLMYVILTYLKCWFISNLGYNQLNVFHGQSIILLFFTSDFQDDSIFISNLSLMKILKILRYNHGRHFMQQLHFCPVYLTCNMFDPISLSWVQILRQNIDFLWTNILWFACSGLGALDLRHLWSCQLYFIVLSHACQDMIHGKLLNWNGPITCWNFLYLHFAGLNMFSATFIEQQNTCATTFQSIRCYVEWILGDLFYQTEFGKLWHRISLMRVRQLVNVNKILNNLSGA